MAKLIRGLSNPYKWARFYAFHKTLKEWAYAWGYGSAKAKLVHDDFYAMYDMGCEL